MPCEDEIQFPSQSTMKIPRTDNADFRDNYVTPMGTGNDHNDTSTGTNTSTFESTFQSQDDSQSIVTGQVLEENEPSIRRSNPYQKFDTLLSSIVHRDCKYLTSKYFARVEDCSSKLCLRGAENNPDIRATQHPVVMDSRLNQHQTIGLSSTSMKPPPGFYRMRERKRQRGFERLLQQQNSALSTNRSSSNGLKPNRKRLSKSRFNKRQRQVVGEMINGEITDIIPEEITVCLGSPAHDVRTAKFRNLFHQEQLGAVRDN